ncbi:MAG: hypothetical protein KAG28_10775 [Cocleimonas sp.]|nr:hypothetical protein [Cocleimonas sp.]
MYITRWLSHHPILSVWALTIVALLMSLGGKQSSKSPTEAKTEQAQTVVAHTDEKAAPDHEKMAINTAAAIVAVGTTNAVVVATQHNNTPQREEASDTAKVVTTEAESVETIPSVAGLSDKSTEDLLLMAREAYWNNGLDEAASIYQQLIIREPNVVGYKGELGNVFWKQGFPEKSAHLYAEIAIPMIKQGKGKRVANMVGFIGLFHPKKANEIKQLLARVKK